MSDGMQAHRLKNDKGQPNFGVTFYALNKNGEYGCAAIHKGAKMAVNDGKENKLVDGVYLFE
jgi:hypothetical protein